VPFALSLSPDGQKLFVGNQGAKSLSIVETATLTELAEVPLGATAMPYGVQSGPDGSRVYVADNSNNVVLVIDAVAGVVLKQIPVGSLPIAFGEFLRAGTVPTTMTSGGVAPGEVLFRSSSPVVLRAVLTRNGGGAVAGATVEFLLDGAVVGSAVTGGDGAAAFGLNPAGLSAGTHAASARFAGGTVSGTPFGPSSANLGTLRVLYRFDGFLPPLRSGLNERGAGALILAKWRLSDAAGIRVNESGAVVGVATAVMACGSAPSIWTEALAATRYDSSDATYEFRWKTVKSMAGKCARLRVTLADGTSHGVDFSLR
jgi:YVTN family beta-propeller protein